MNHRIRLQRGFTLIELLIVIVILGLLLSLVAPTMFSKVSSSQRKTALAQMQMLATSLDTYRLDLGDYRRTLPSCGKAPARVGRAVPAARPAADPWGHPYQYQLPGENGQPYTLRSFGKDGSPGGEDDAADIVFQ